MIYACYLAESLDLGVEVSSRDNFFVVVISSRFEVCECHTSDYLGLVGVHIFSKTEIFRRCV